MAAGTRWHCHSRYRRLPAAHLCFHRTGIPALQWAGLLRPYQAIRHYCRGAATYLRQLCLFLWTSLCLVRLLWAGLDGMAAFRRSHLEEGLPLHPDMVGGCTLHGTVRHPLHFQRYTSDGIALGLGHLAAHRACRLWCGAAGVAALLGSLWAYHFLPGVWLAADRSPSYFRGRAAGRFSDWYSTAGAGTPPRHHGGRRGSVPVA